MEEPTISYKQVSKLVDDWVPFHIGQTFDIDMICRDLQAVSRSARHAVTTKLFNDQKAGRLEKLNRLYRYLSLDKEIIPWYDYTDTEPLPFSWPKGRDGTSFPFDGHITMREKDLFIIGGVSNKGKSCLCKNLVWENMDNWNGRLSYFVNEFQPARFAKGADLMGWKTPFNSDGTRKFELIRQEADWQYAIEPDHLNIIDWIEMEDEFYKIATILKAIQQRLRKGMAVVVLQKGEGNTLAIGGQFSEHRSSYYWAVDEGRLLFKKAKEFNGYNPNYKTFGFEMAEGVYLNKLKEVHMCGQCSGKGTRWDKTVMENRTCIGCSGKGWL